MLCWEVLGFTMQLDLEVSGDFPKNHPPFTLWVVGSIPTHSNVIVQLVRTIEGKRRFESCNRLSFGLDERLVAFADLKSVKTEFIHSLK